MDISKQRDRPSILAAMALAVALLFVAVGCDSGGTMLSRTPRPATFTGRLQEGVSPAPASVECSWLEDASGGRIEVFYPDGWQVCRRRVKTEPHPPVQN